MWKTIRRSNKDRQAIAGSPRKELEAFRPAFDSTSTRLDLICPARSLHCSFFPPRGSGQQKQQRQRHTFSDCTCTYLHPHLHHTYSGTFSPACPVINK